MTFNRSTISIAVACSMTMSAHVLADDAVEQITIFGSQQAVDATPGSGVYIDSESLEDYAITDINRILSSAPGVYFMEEDGYGLRPNIGMRGNSSDRSEKVTITEDGVLAAPAPYASPAAYYFPTVGRMSAVEILKGSSGVKYGPRTSGGVINLVSTQIPEEALTGKFDISAGSDSFRKLHTFVGGTSKDKDVGALVEIFHFGTDGFKSLNSGQDTGFEKTDIHSKVALTLDEDNKHELEFKVKYSTESSDETYLGITLDDFDNDPYQRYSASQRDNMDVEHLHLSAHYDFYISNDVDLSVIVYHNDFHRNWYKTQKVGGNNLGSGAEEAAAAFDTAIANGGSPDPLEVRLRANNRDYLAQGIQAQLGYRFDNHNVNFGLRFHRDEMDRFQWEDDYLLNNDFSLTLVNAGVPGTNSNRIDSADAISLFVEDEISLGKLIITGGLRYENIILERDDWGTSDPQRINTAAHRHNEIKALLPSLGATYQLNDNVLILAGVQKAFAPPSPGNQNAEEEKGWNYEAGSRFNYASWKGEIIAFYTDLDNLHGNCTASQGCIDDNPIDQFNAGAVEIRGIEVAANKVFDLGAVNIPVNINYTYSNAEFQESFESQLDFWGSVQAGDELPYLPEQIWQIETGVQGEGWHALVAIKYFDDVRTTAGSETITRENGVESRTIVDLSANYQINQSHSVYAVVDNLLDKEYVSTVRHGGVQSGKPRTVQVGYRAKF